MTREEAIQRFNGITNAMSISVAQAKFYPTKAELDELCDMAIEALSADAVHGEWIDIDNYYRMATCSHCHKVTMFEKWGEYTKPYDFCPNCGARMKGGDTE